MYYNINTYIIIVILINIMILMMSDSDPRVIGASLAPPVVIY